NGILCKFNYLWRNLSHETYRSRCSFMFALSSVVAPVTAVAERKGLVGLDSLTSYTSQTIPRAFWTTFSVFRHDIGSPDVQKTLKEHVCKDRVMQLGGHYSLQVVVCQKKSMKRKAR
ncbi:hypothetical protein H704_00821, partial [Bartonella bacilliformis Peru38]|uniref:hypothetical protein n=1 Tax=Bartonella bacilliformis TaxID=774 RepID=UPI0004A05B49